MVLVNYIAVLSLGVSEMHFFKYPINLINFKFEYNFYYNTGEYFLSNYLSIPGKGSDNFFSKLRWTHIGKRFTWEA